MSQIDRSRLQSYTPTVIENPRKQAAVIAPIIERESDTYLLFTKRAAHLGEHPGQMSFPGGGTEPSDTDLKATARREAHEEISLDPDTVQFVGQLDEIETTSGYAVRPFVADVPDSTYVPDEREVAEIVLLSVSELKDRTNYESERREHPQYGNIRIHFFHVDGYTVWGATGRMLVQLLELTTTWEMPTSVDRVVDPDADYPV